MSILLAALIGQMRVEPIPFDFIKKFHGVQIPESTVGLSKADGEQLKKVMVTWSFTAPSKDVLAAARREMVEKGWRIRPIQTMGGHQRFVKPNGAFAFLVVDRQLFPQTPKNVTCTFSYSAHLPKRSAPRQGHGSTGSD